eukprot:CAMPEP_0171271308 /NCGR_PEP_ID=MMETSP0790-20130122/61163_1 /TAXON_ID=2925 /ORGANISM="Alexandrium catenella, Strain OF101" /LENGTH=177 /DNA_ID=CAMNT_0011740183 /DNA_START=9 /DNA_END=540 /DNA_ORIENTATION=-
MTVLAEEMIQRIGKLEPQHMSITAWAHARLQFVIAEAAAGVADRFDAQGVGNIVWASGVLGFRSEALIQSMVERAKSLTAQLTASEISSAALGVHLLNLPKLLRKFLECVIVPFGKFGAPSDGPAWVDLANIACSAVRTSGEFAGSAEFAARFRQLVLDPLQNGLAKVAHDHTLAAS